ncbi:hypothetical protein ASF49_15145 [Methylobacterium sp. Leaf104]|nr:hypothetical protein ASF49_15145 [Methylobacterium sp. Leaf104]MCI9882296.1 hypothetical protein [Methylobacterium goesingense]
MPESEGADALDRLSEVVRLATLLADQVLDAQIMSRPVPDEHIRALLEAALVLRQHGQELPSLLGQIMHGISAEALKDPAEAQQSAAEDEATGRLAWMFRPLQGAKD